MSQKLFMTFHARGEGGKLFVLEMALLHCIKSWLKNFEKVCRSFRNCICAGGTESLNLLSNILLLLADASVWISAPL